MKFGLYYFIIIVVTRDIICALTHPSVLYDHLLVTLNRHKASENYGAISK